MATPEIPHYVDFVTSDYTLYMNPPAYPLDRELKPNYKFIWPLFRETTVGEEFTREKANGKKIVFISLGTIFNSNLNFYQICINAFL